MGNTRLTIEDLPVVLVLAAPGWTTRTPVDPARRRRGTRRQWAGGGIRLRRRRARPVRIGGAGSCRLRIHSLAPLEPHGEVCEWVNGRSHQMTRDQMIWSAHPQVADGHARGGGTGFRLPSKELPHLRLKSQAQIRGMARDMLHGGPEAGCGCRRGHREPCTCACLVDCVRGHDPRRRTQYSETTQDQQIAHMAASRVLV